MKSLKIFVAFSFIVMYSSCLFDGGVEVPDFDYEQSIIFENNLSSYNIFEGTTKDLIPSSEFYLLELSSTLYTDHSQKQRLIYIPNGTTMSQLSEGFIEFPDSTIMVKTFFYYVDERDIDLGKNVIETRLMIKLDDIWNVATYIWNEEQTDATLELLGSDTDISWIDGEGSELSTIYHIPDENECIACHQNSEAVVPLGTTLININKDVIRNNVTINQIEYLQAEGLISTSFNHNDISEIVDYSDNSMDIDARGRAYLQMNCAHCHNPAGWEPAADQNFDFRYSVDFNDTGLSRDQAGTRVINQVRNGNMPFLGKTIIDESGLELLTEYINGL